MKMFYGMKAENIVPFGEGEFGIFEGNEIVYIYVNNSKI
jgi:hypothetical protein